MLGSAVGRWLLVALSGVSLCACNALLDIDDVIFSDGVPDAGGGGTAVGGSAGSAAGGMAGTGGSAGAGGSGGAGGAVLGPWAAPTLVIQLSDNDSDEDDPCFTADGLELFFNTDRDHAGVSDIWVSTRATTSLPWGPPSEVVELNSSADDTNMAVAPDGLTIWFCSERVSEHDIYVSTRPSRTSAWEVPVLVPELSSGQEECPGSVSADGLTMLLSRSSGGTWDLYRATRASSADPWGTPELFTELNSTANDLSPWLSPDGLAVYFDSERDDPAGDIYQATRLAAGDSFEPPTAVDELNTTASDTDAWLSPDLRYIMFSRGPQPRDIYEASR